MILEHLVISMGVTDKEVTDKVKKGKDGPTSSELSAILKVIIHIPIHCLMF